MSKTKPVITAKKIEKRAELLLTALTLLWETNEKKMLRTEFLDLIKELPNANNTLQVLRTEGVVTSISGGNKHSSIQYTGIAPNIVVCKKIIESVIAKGREWQTRHQANKRNNIKKTVAEISAITVKPAPLYYDAFLREIKILKERYRMTVPNGEVEVIVRVSSTANV